MIVRHMYGHIYRHICSAQHRTATHTNAPPCYCLCCLCALTADTSRPRCTHCLACFPACYPAHIPPTPQRLHGLLWEDRSQRAHHPPTLATNAVNGSTTKRQPQHLTHSPTIQRRRASRSHCRQFRQPGLFRPDSPQWIAQTVNDRQPAERNSARLAAALATLHRPGPYQSPQFAPTGQHSPAFPPDICGRSATTRAGILACSLAYLCMNV